MLDSVLVLKQVIPKERIHKHISEYNRSNTRHPGIMNTADPGVYMNAYDDLISSHLRKKVTAISGNYYKHSIPYLPHTDWKSHLANVYNAVIPLHYTQDQPRFIIFDQIWKYESVTWAMGFDVKMLGNKVGVNTAVIGCPNDYDVKNLINKPIDDRLYEENLSHYTKEMCYGLSGTVTHFEPGDIILFNNQNIHCTSTFSGEKLGLSLRFKYG